MSVVVPSVMGHIWPYNTLKLQLANECGSPFSDWTPLTLTNTLNLQQASLKKYAK